MTRPGTGWTAAVIRLAVTAALVAPAPAAAQDSDGPLGVVHQLFDAMRARDTTGLRQVFHPDARLMSVGRDRDGAPVVQTASVDAFVRAVGSAKARLDERISKVEVRVHEGLATVWARYTLYADTTLSHCGVDAFQLARTSDGWRIIQVADTRRREGCDE